VTLPEGVYWTDPVYGRADLPYCLASALFALINAADGDAVLTKAAAPNPTTGSTLIAPPAYEYEDTTYSAPNALRVTPSTANTAGREVLTRLGFPPGTETDFAPFRGPGVVHGFWWPRDRQERNASWVERKSTMGSVLRSPSGLAYPYTVGGIGKTRNVVLERVQRDWVENETGKINTGFDDDLSALADTSCFTLFWQWAARGELVRVYSDTSAPRTYLTSAMTATDTTCVVAGATGLAEGVVIWIDGEKCIISGVAGVTLTVIRPEPVAHPAGAPVSTAHVATYALADDGGNVNQLDFMPQRVAPAVPYYDMDIALVRARWNG